MNTVLDWQTVLIVLTLIVGLYALYRSYKKGDQLTPLDVVETIKEAQPVAMELMEVAQIAVNATEELRRQGKITENRQAFNHALDLIKKWIPDEWEVDNDDIVNAINAAVLVASALRKQAGPADQSTQSPIPGRLN